jgi:3',5'-cyclic AMP phosphodiesterase CpdA
MKFLHISDLHIQSNDDSDNADVKSTLNYIKKKYPKHCLIVTGDVTDDGTEDQYRNAAEYFEGFVERVFFCPGNHDFGLQGNFFSEERAKRFDKMLMEPFKQGGTFTGDQTPLVHTLKDGTTTVRLIGLDSNLETESPFDFACGEIGATQLKFLNSVLSSPAIPEMRTLLYFHHHPLMHNNPFMELKDAEGLMRTIYNKSVDVVLFGHKHESKMWKNMNGIPYFLAADNSPGKDFAREIDVTGTEVTVKDVKIA